MRYSPRATRRPKLGYGPFVSLLKDKFVPHRNCEISMEVTMNGCEMGMDNACDDVSDVFDDQPVDVLNSSTTDHHPGSELLQVMASLGLNENITPPCTESESSSDSTKQRRKLRKRPIPRVSTGGVTKRRRGTMRQLRTSDKDSLIHESDDVILDFYVNYNKRFKNTPTQSLETIYEEPKEKDGTVVFSGSKKKRFLPFSDFVTKAKLRSRRLKIKSLCLDKALKKKDKKKITIEDVKKRLAESGIIN